MSTVIISSPQAMIDLGNKLAASDHHKILLYGDLGAGKTHFTKGFAAHYSINPSLVTSPTYIYLNEHQQTILHIDMYRIEDADQLTKKGILDLIHDYDHILIERPKFTELYVDDSRTTVTITKTSETEREVTITAAH